KIRVLELVGTQRQFGPASCHECSVVTPNGLRADAEFAQAWDFVLPGVAELDHPAILPQGKTVAPGPWGRESRGMTALGVRYGHGRSKVPVGAGAHDVRATSQSC